MSDNVSSIASWRASFASRLNPSIGQRPIKKNGIASSRSLSTLRNNVPSYKGKFITFEGGEGCGKSTQSKLLARYLISKNIKVNLTREVGGTEAAEKIRDILVNQDLLPMSELMLVMAARYEHIHTRIIPALAQGEWVICDRFIDSTACYQGQAEGVGIDLVYDLHQHLMSNIMPDITFFIDIPPEVAVQRALLRGDGNKFDSKDADFHQKIYEGFKYIATKFPDRVVQIAGSHCNAEEIHFHIIANRTFNLL